MNKLHKLVYVLICTMITYKSATASNFFFYSQLPGFVNSSETGPFAYSDIEDGVYINCDKGIILNSTETFKSLDFIIQTDSDIDAGDVELKIKYNENPIINLPTITDNSSSNKTLNITRDINDDRGSTDVIIEAYVDNKIVSMKQLTVTVEQLSTCANSIDTTNQTDPSGKASYISCDANGNYLIATAEDLLHISRNQDTPGIASYILSGDYKVLNDISFDDRISINKQYDQNGFLESISSNLTTSNVDWNGDSHTNSADNIGWRPIGYNDTYKFTGYFNGNNKKIYKLYSDRSDVKYHGLFGRSSGTIKDISVLDSSVKTYQRDSGILVGNSAGGTVSNCHTSGVIYGESNVGDIIMDSGTGGLIGYAYKVFDSSSSADVWKIQAKVGGLVGHTNNGALIENSYATGDVRGGTYTAGLLGNAWSVTVNNSMYSGNVLSTGDRVGGLIGYHKGNITNSYSEGKVFGEGSYTGGLVGYSQSSIYNSHSSADAYGTSYVGGLIGYNNSTGSSINSYATGSVSGSSNIGGTAGKNDGYLGNNNDVCTYTDGDTTPCQGEDLITLKLDLVNGIWGDDIWENLADVNPKLEWENAGYFTSNISVELPAVCSSANPLDDIFLDNGYYMIGTNADASVSNDSALAKQQLLCLANNQTTEVRAADYKLTADVTFNADPTQEDWNGDATPDGAGTKGWSVINNHNGIFDGQNHYIYNLYINRPTATNQGLFGVAEYALKNIHLRDVNITGKSNVGSLVGYMEYSSGREIRNCSATGNVTGTGSYTGGLSGQSYVIYDSTADVTVNGVAYVGGLTGYTRSIYRSTATGQVTGSGNSVGGLAGGSNHGWIQDSYTTGSNTVVGVSNVGGILGAGGDGARVKNCYSTRDITGTGNNIGGVVGWLGAQSSWPAYLYNSYSVNGTITASGAKGRIIGNKNTYGNFYNEVCMYVNESSVSTCSTLDIYDIQDGGTWDAWSTTYWNNLGTSTTPTLK